MTKDETRAIVTISLLAAFADAGKHERERAEIRRIAETLAGEDGLHLPALAQDVLLKRVTLASAAPALSSPEARQLAYEMAVGVCDSDGAQSPAERAFLAELARALKLEAGVADEISGRGETLASAPLTEPAPAAAGAAVNEAELDAAILNAAILNGALELLPESLSTLAIIPLQMKLVYRTGKAYGYELDRGHIKDFLATAGVGLTSQYLEQAGRKLLGGLLGSAGGGLLGGLGRQAVSSGMSFASTYALGHAAKRYYAGGRVLSAQMLKDAYAGMLREAQGLRSRYLPQMQEKAGGLNAAQVMKLVGRG